MMLNMGRIPGVGLAKGLSITLRHMLRKSVTQQYPEVKPALPPRSRGVIALVEENCTSCMLCARECPDWCIYIDSHKETLPAPEGGRPRQRNVLDRFAIDFALCMYCGICIEVCPFDALFWSPEFEYAEGDIRNLLHEKDKLAGWVETVPPPPPHDPGAEPPKELTAAPRRPARSADAPPARATRAAGKAAAPGTDTAPDPGAEPDTSPRTGTAKPDPAAEAATSQVEPQDGVRAPEAESPESQAQQEAPEQQSAGAGAPPAEPEERGGRSRRPMGNVRGIRPPGTLPSSGSEGRPEPPSSTGHETGAAMPTSSDHETMDAGPTERPSPARPDAEPSPEQRDADGPSPGQRDPGESSPAGRDPGESPQAGPDPGESTARPDLDESSPARPGDDESPTTPPGGEASSTGRSSEEELSTGSQEPRPEPGPEGQTSGASPRRRKMADPRSIRPPGRLGPDEPREPEEES